MLDAFYIILLHADGLHEAVKETDAVGWGAAQLRSSLPGMPVLGLMASLRPDASDTSTWAL